MYPRTIDGPQYYRKMLMDLVGLWSFSTEPREGCECSSQHRHCYCNTLETPGREFLTKCDTRDFLSDLYDFLEEKKGTFYQKRDTGYRHTG